MRSRFLTDLTPDSPVSLDAGYKFNHLDRRLIDEQIRGAQKAISDCLSGGRIASHFKVSASSDAINAGDVLVTSASSTPDELTKGYGAALDVAGGGAYVALADATPGGRVLAAVSGVVPQSVTGLPIGSPGGVKVNRTTARCEYTADFSDADYVVGYLDAAGNLSLVQVRSGEAIVVNVKAFGAVGNGIHDDEDAFDAACAVADATGGELVIPPGNYKNAFIRMMKGFRAIGQGNPVVRGMWIGDVPLDGAGQHRTGVVATLLTADPSAGAYAITVASAAGIAAGDWLLIASKPSSFSSVNNWVPLYFQYVRVESISSNTITCQQRIKHPFTVADGAIVFKNPKLCVNGLVDGIVFQPGNTEVYAHFVQSSVHMTIKDCVFFGPATFGAMVFSDGIVYENIRAVGVNAGILCARGTGRAIFRNINMELDPANGQNYAAFFEESIENIVVKDSTFLGGRVYVTSLSDVDGAAGVETLQRRIKYQNCKIKNSGQGIITQKSAYLKIEFDGCVLEGGSGYTDATVGLTTASMIGTSYNLADGVTVRNSIVISDDGSAIHSQGSAGFQPKLQNNVYFGASPPEVEVAPTHTATTLTYGTRYLETSAGGRRRKYTWDLRALPAGTYTLFSSNVANGQHVYSVRVQQSETGKAVAYSASVVQEYNAAPVVTSLGSKVYGMTITPGISGTTTATLTVITTAASGNYVFEVDYISAFSPTPVITVY